MCRKLTDAGFRALLSVFCVCLLCFFYGCSGVSFVGVVKFVRLRAAHRPHHRRYAAFVLLLCAQRVFACSAAALACPRLRYLGAFGEFLSFGFCSCFHCVDCVVVQVLMRYRVRRLRGC